MEVCRDSSGDLLPDGSESDCGVYEGKVTIESYREANAILFGEE